MRMIFILAPFLLINQMLAQETTRFIRLADCITQALERNPALHISEAKVQAAEARSSEAMTALLPQLKIQRKSFRVKQS